MELRHLRYFIAVAEELHFGRAARKLGITQPPLSLQIQRLEAELDVELFERTNRRVQPHTRGQNVVELKRATWSPTSTAAADAARRAARGETGSLTVAFAASVMFLSLPRIIRRFRSDFPDVRLELRELPTGRQISALRNGELDIGFLREPPRDDELSTETVMRERLLLALSKRHELASRKRLRLADVANEDFVLFPRDLAPGLHAHVLAVCAEAGVIRASCRRAASCTRRSVSSKRDSGSPSFPRPFDRWDGAAFATTQLHRRRRSRASTPRGGPTTQPDRPRVLSRSRAQARESSGGYTTPASASTNARTSAVVL